MYHSTTPGSNSIPREPLPFPTTLLFRTFPSILTIHLVVPGAFWTGTLLLIDQFILRASLAIRLHPLPSQVRDGRAAGVELVKKDAVTTFSGLADLVNGAAGVADVVSVAHCW